MRAPGRTPEVVTARTAARTAIAGATALMLIATATTNPSPAPPVQAAPIAAALVLEAPAATAAAAAALSDRVERLRQPPASRSAPARPVRARPAAVARKAVGPAARIPVRRAAARLVLRIRAVVGFARAQVGDPYVRNAAGPGAWDCSGLTQKAFARAGVRLPHRAAWQSARGRGVPRRAARAGDLVLWGGVGSAYHVGIYLGRGRVLHSPRPGKSVRAAPLWGSPQFRRLV